MKTCEIPKGEMENFVSVYWQMLRELEGKCNPKKDPGLALIVEAGYRVLNRSGMHDGKPSWKE